MHTRKASFRLLSIMACFAAVLGLATACARPLEDPCIEERVALGHPAARPSDKYIQDVLSRHIYEFLDLPGYVNMTRQQGGRSGEYGILVVVENVYALDIGPLPKCIEGVPIRFEIGAAPIPH